MAFMACQVELVGGSASILVAESGAGFSRPGAGAAATLTPKLLT